MSSPPSENDVMIYVILRGGSCIPIRISKSLLQQTMALLLTMLNDLENPVHKYFMAESAAHLPLLILMKEVIGYYTVLCTLSAQERLASAMEKQIGTGEDWKDE